MKHSISNVPIQALLFLGLTMTTASVLQAEPHCPGNVSSLRLRLVQPSLILVPIEINNTGPYDFMVDTGAQITTVDSALVSTLHLKILGEAGFTGIGFHSRTPFVQLDSLQAGSHAVDSVLAAIQDPGQVQISDPHVRGILGSNFLEHFDVLVDYAHSLFCLDDGKLMQANVKGAHIALARAPHPKRDLPFMEQPIVPVHVSGIKAQLLLQLDSGSNAPMLFEAGQELTRALLVSAPLRTRGADGVEREFAILPPQEVQVGNHVLPRVPFVAPTDSGENMPKVDFDGLLPTVLFQRVFISYADHYAVLDPW
jgi:hypothetical protein